MNMTPNDFVAWLKEYIDDPNMEGDMDYMIWLIRQKMPKATAHCYPFCGGTWNAGSFDYYWTPGNGDVLVSETMIEGYDDHST